MSLITRAQAARTAAADLAARGSGWFNGRERAAQTTARQFIERALSLPDHAQLPPAEREELKALIGGTIESIEAYISRPGERTASRDAADRDFVKLVYGLREAEERVSQGIRPV